MKKPLTAIRFVVPAQMSEIPFALREAQARIVGMDIQPKLLASYLKEKVGETVTVAFTSLYGREAKQNLDYLAAKITGAGGSFIAARDLYPLPHGADKVDELLARAAFPVVGPSFVDQPAQYLDEVA